MRPDSEGKEKKKKRSGGRVVIGHVATRGASSLSPGLAVRARGHGSAAAKPQERPRIWLELLVASYHSLLASSLFFFFLSRAPRHGEAWQHSRVTDTQTHTRTHMVTKTPTVVVLGKAPSVGRALVTMATTTSLESHWWWWSVWCVFSSFILF